MTALTHPSPRGGRGRVGFNGPQESAIDVTLVREIRGRTPEAAPPHECGVVRSVPNPRGTAPPILDLAARLGLEPDTPTPHHVIMVVQENRQMLGLLLDPVSDFLLVGEDHIQPTAELHLDAAREFVRGVPAVDGRPIAILCLKEAPPATSQRPVAA